MKGRGRSSRPHVEMLLEKSRPQQVDGRGWERAGEQQCRREARKASGSGYVSMGGQLPPVAAGGIRWLGQGSPLAEI